jgi:hypothetical protein
MGAARLTAPPGVEVLVANVGAPYAGMNVAGATEVTDHVGAAFFWAVGATLTRYPAPAPGVTVESWVTPWPNDPVMMPRMGHDPGDPRVGPPGPRHRLAAGTDHNKVLLEVVRALLARATDETVNASARAPAR